MDSPDFSLCWDAQKNEGALTFCKGTDTTFYIYYETKEKEIDCIFRQLSSHVVYFNNVEKDLQPLIACKWRTTKEVVQKHMVSLKQAQDFAVFLDPFLNWALLFCFTGPHWHLHRPHKTGSLELYLL